MQKEVQDYVDKQKLEARERIESEAAILSNFGLLIYACAENAEIAQALDQKELALMMEGGVDAEVVGSSAATGEATSGGATMQIHRLIEWIV